MSKHINRRHFLRVASVTVLGGVAAACTPSTPTPNAQLPADPTAAEAVATEAVATEAVVPTAVEAVATETAAPLEEAAIRFIFPGAPVPEDTSPFDALNEITRAKFNTTINYEMLDWSVYGEKQSLYHASGEEVDIEFAAPWLAEAFTTAAANGAYLPLDDLLPQYAPSIWSRILPEWWRAVTVNGHIYAVINEQYFPKPWGIRVRTDMVEKYNIDLDAITAYDSEEMFRLLHALGDADKENLEFPWAQTYPSGPDIWGYDSMAKAGTTEFVVNFDDQSRKVVNWHETPEFMRFAKMMKRLADEGLSKNDPLKVVHDQTVALMKEGKVRFAFVIQNRPGSEESSNAETLDEGYTWKHKTIAPVRLSTGSITATLLAVPATSKHPDRAVMFMELLGSDEAFFNLLAYGIEGKHWEWSDKEKKLVKLVEGSKYDLHNNGWMYVNQFLEYPCEAGFPTVGMWDIQGHQQNLDAPASVMVGFVPNPKEFEDKAALLASGGSDAFIQKIIYADGDPEQNVADLIAWEKENGVDEVLAKLQAQVDTWAKGL